MSKNNCPTCNQALETEGFDITIMAFPDSLKVGDLVSMGDNEAVGIVMCLGSRPTVKRFMLSDYESAVRLSYELQEESKKEG